MEESRELVRRIRAGESHKFCDLVEQYKRLVYTIVFRMVPNKTDCEDICQEVFVKIYQNLGSFHFEAKLSTWIGRIAFNASVNYLKKKKVALFDDNATEGETLEAFGDSGATPEQTTLAQDLSTIVRDEVARLAPQFRAVVTLYHLEEMSYAEIGEIMDMPAGTVKSYLFRARQQLKKKISDKYVEAELWHDSI